MTDNVCKIVGCEKSMSNKKLGLCPMHRTRFRRHGDPLYVTPILRRQGWIKDGIGYIPLTRGGVALCDPEDYENIIKLTWRLEICKGCKYAVRTKKIGKKNTTLKMHQFILGRKEGYEIDHINRDGLDNRRSNLRYATPSQNKMNKAKWKGAKMSKYIGVNWHARDKNWSARIRYKGKPIVLGYSKSEETAAVLYDLAAQVLNDGFSVLNFKYPLDSHP